MSTRAHDHHHRPLQERRRQPRDRLGTWLVASVWGVLTLLAAGAVLLQAWSD